MKYKARRRVGKTRYLFNFIKESNSTRTVKWLWFNVPVKLKSITWRLHNAQKWAFSNGIKRYTENHGHVNVLS